MDDGKEMFWSVLTGCGGSEQISQSINQSN